ncbi:ABC transporter permease [Streptomyces sp. NPDC002143]
MTVGRLLLISRLIARDLRRRPGEAVMFLIAVTAATAALTLGLATDNTVATAYAKTRAATAGPDVMVSTTDSDPSGIASRFAREPGVTALGGPFFAFDTTIRAHGRSAHSAVEGRGSSRSAVDRPLVTSGSWVRAGGAVIERGFAQSLGIRVGDSITVGGRNYPVVGTAISAATAVYPWGDPAQVGPSDAGGLVWLTTADAHAAADDAPAVHLIYLKLSDPAATTAFGNSPAVQAIGSDSWVGYHYWQDVLQRDMAMIEFTRPTLVVGGWLLAVAAIVTLAALTAVRAGRDRRRAGLLKAVGAGPGQAVSALCVAQLLSVVPGLVAGIPAGLGLYWLFGETVTPPTAWLLTAALAILTAVGALTALPAWAHTRSPAGRALDAEPV